MYNLCHIYKTTLLGRVQHFRAYLLTEKSDKYK